MAGERRLSLGLVCREHAILISLVVHHQDLFVAQVMSSGLSCWKELLEILAARQSTRGHP